MSKIEVNTVDAQCGSTITVGSSGKNVKIEGNDIRSNDYKASDGGNIINQSGTSITLGASGDTINLASGASQTGFGRTGTVDWQTTPKTGDFTAADGEGYFVNTTSGAINASLPAGSAGAIVAFKDYAGTWGSNNFTVTPNGSDKLNGSAGVGTFDTTSLSTTLIFVDSTRGWMDIHDSTNVSQANSFICASVSGACNTLTTVCTNFKLATFKGPGTFTVNSGGGAKANVDYLVVAGGGGTGGLACQTGGGGAGGFRLSIAATCMPAPQSSPLAAPAGIPLSPGPYTVTVGGGGAPMPTSPGISNPGNNSVFSTITSTGGGGGRAPSPVQSGRPGGSGGGSRNTTGANGNTPPVSPPQGNNGGTGDHSGPQYGSGGGGGAGAVGGSGNSGAAGNGGAGSYVVQTGFAGCNGVAGPVSGARYFAGGGGGGSEGSGGTGGTGGGGNGTCNSGSAVGGTANTGGGAGSGGDSDSNGAGGGSGIVIIRYKFQ